MYIQNFGLFWEEDEVEWNPGQGKTFHLLGRIGYYRPGLKLADFRYQKGIYILYNNYGPYYVGLTDEQGLGKRLLDHTKDVHAGKWTRFSWFGFCKVLEKRDDNRYCQLKDIANTTISNPKDLINDVEALLIRVMGTTNVNKTIFTQADEWYQVEKDEVDYLNNKL